MKEIRVSFDSQKYQSKPSEASDVLSKRLARSPKLLKPDEIREFAFHVGQDGCTFSPATFSGGSKKKENFIQQQLFALDFDNKEPGKKVSLDEIRERAESYDLPILFAYDTFSSTDHDKFRVVFLNDVSINDSRVAEAMQLAMGEMFPEADPSCYKDVSKMYFGGKELVYYDDRLPTTNIESIIRNYTCYTKTKYKDNHYKEHIRKFSTKTGIALTKNGLLDVTSSDYLPETDNPTEYSGAIQLNKNGKNSPTAIIYDKNNIYIKEDGEIFPNKYYVINFNNIDTRNSSVKTPDEKSKNHKEYRSGVLKKIEEKCRLFHDFATGNKKLSHDELFGIATNLIQVDSGIKYFKKKRLQYQNLYTDDNKNKRWEDQITYMSQHGYYPESCERYCPYHEECNHSKNILSTVCAKRGNMKKIEYHEEFCPMEEMQDDIYNAVNKAFHSSGKKFYIIKAQTGGGKSYSYLKLMEEYPEERFLIAAPTNLLKDEILIKADKLGIEAMKTPSLEEIKYEIPEKVWDRIQKFYKRGQHNRVHRYISDILKKTKILCLERYMKERDRLKKWKGNIITTHRYLLSMDGNRLKEYDAIIIDEDIIFKSVISNQGEITASKLQKLARETTDAQLKKKVKKLLELSETQSCIKLESFEWDDDERPVSFDIPAFCQAEYFYMRRAAKEDKLKEDTIVFLKPAEFPAEKYIMVSATADRDICCQFFGEDNVNFYECKKAEYMGTLNQYPQRSMSRSSIKSDQGIVRRLMSHFHVNGDKVITFMSENTGELHFGNTEGSNTLEGEDILVIGTPYHAGFLYKLVAFTIGMDFDEDEEMELQTVEHNGYRFSFNTFRNKNLRAVQFWMLESELEQAVGRARLLRNECQVHLFSNFPLSQSKMVEDFGYGEI